MSKFWKGFSIQAGIFIILHIVRIVGSKIYASILLSPRGDGSFVNYFVSPESSWQQLFLGAIFIYGSISLIISAFRAKKSMMARGYCFASIIGLLVTLLFLEG